MNYEQTLKSNFMDKNKHLITIKNPNFTRNSTIIKYTPP